MGVALIERRAFRSYAYKALGAGPVSAAIPNAGTHPVFASLDHPLSSPAAERGLNSRYSHHRVIARNEAISTHAKQVQDIDTHGTCAPADGITIHDYLIQV